VVFGTQAGVLGDVGGIGGVAGFGDAPAVGGEGLCGCGLATVVSLQGRLIIYLFAQFFICSVINSPTDLIPPDVRFC